MANLDYTHCESKDYYDKVEAYLARTHPVVIFSMKPWPVGPPREIRDAVAQTLQTVLVIKQRALCEEVILE